MVLLIGAFRLVLDIPHHANTNQDSITCTGHTDIVLAGSSTANSKIGRVIEDRRVAH